MSHFKYSSGFTLIEIIIVIVIFSLIFSFGMFTSVNSYNRYVFNSEKEILITTLYRARSLAMNNIMASDYGIHIDDGRYIIFKGKIYDKNNPENLFIEKNTSVHIHGISEVAFSALSGNPDLIGEIILANDTQTSSIFIENEGKISW